MVRHCIIDMIVLFYLNLKTSYVMVRLENTRFLESAVVI